MRGSDTGESVAVKRLIRLAEEEEHEKYRGLDVVTRERLI